MVGNRALVPGEPLDAQRLDRRDGLAAILRLWPQLHERDRDLSEILIRLPGTPCVRDERMLKEDALDLCGVDVRHRRR